MAAKSLTAKMAVGRCTAESSRVVAWWPAATSNPERMQPAPLDEVLGSRGRLPNILDDREALEVKIAMVDAERRTPEDLLQIETALVTMAPRADGAEQGDAEFHGVVTAAAHSGVLAQMVAELGPEVATTREESLG